MKIVIVTGSSSGIGLECASRLARQGYHVLAGVRSQKDAAKIKTNNIDPVLLDVTRQESVDAALAATRALLGRAEVVHLVNNAGIAVAGPVEGVPLASWQEQFDVNVFGLVRVTQAFLPFVRATKGRVVNISSVSGRAANPYLAPYSSSKYAVEAISDSLRRELRQFGCQVAVIEPGPIATPIWKKGLGQGDELEAAMAKEVAEAYREELQKFQAMVAIEARRAISVDKVGDAVAHALTAAKPRTRYVVAAKPMPAMVQIAGLLPDSWMDSLVAREFRKEFRPRA